MKNILLLSTCLLFTLLQGFAQSINIIEKNIDQKLIGPGVLEIELTDDTFNDIKFDILNLGANGLAARVSSINGTGFLDNSTFGYPDALTYGSPVIGYFNYQTGVLGTFNNAGQFKGMGPRYLGIQLYHNGNNTLGWILLNCSALNDTLHIINCGYLDLPYNYLNAGQTGQVFTSVHHSETLQPSDIIYIADNGILLKNNFENHTAPSFFIMDMSGRILMQGMASERISVAHLSAGAYMYVEPLTSTLPYRFVVQ